MVRLGVSGLTRAEEKIRSAMSSGKSPQDIADELSRDERFSGYSAEQVYGVINRILSSLDAYSLDQQLKLSILDLRELAAAAKENYGVTGRAEHLRGAVDALDKSMNHIEYLMTQTRGVLSELGDKQKQLLVWLVSETVSKLLVELSSRYEGFDVEEAEGEFRRLLSVTALSVDDEVEFLEVES